MFARIFSRRALRTQKKPRKEAHQFILSFFEEALANLKEATELYLSEFRPATKGRAILATFVQPFRPTRLFSSHWRARCCRLLPPPEGRRLQNNFKIFVVLMNIYANI
jgi:hypothetical protein